MLALPHFLTISSGLSIVWLIQFCVLGTFSFLFCFIDCLFFDIILFYFILFYSLFFILLLRVFLFFISCLPCWTENCK
jgi:hypothetical protein